MCASIKPGMRYFPVPSIVRAPAGACACAPASLMVLPSITTVAFGTDAAPGAVDERDAANDEHVAALRQRERDSAEDEHRQGEKPFHDPCSYRLDSRRVRLPTFAPIVGPGAAAGRQADPERSRASTEPDTTNERVSQWPLRARSRPCSRRSLPRRSPPVGRSLRTTSPADLAGRPIILVTVDTLRADRLGAYGSAKGLTPALDRFAQGAARFTAAVTQAPLTLPAHATILTGLHPARHGIRTNDGFRLAARVPTLAEALGARGYATGAFIGGYPLQASFGLGRGFDRYDDEFLRVAGVVERPADEVVRSAAAWIDERAVAAVLRLAAPVRSALAVHAAGALCRGARRGAVRRRGRLHRRRDRTAVRAPAAVRPLLARRHPRRRRSRRVARRARRADARHVSLRRDGSRAAARQAPRRRRRARGCRPRRNDRPGADDRVDRRRVARRRRRPEPDAAPAEQERGRRSGSARIHRVVLPERPARLESAARGADEPMEVHRGAATRAVRSRKRSGRAAKSRRRSRRARRRPAAVRSRQPAPTRARAAACPRPAKPPTGCAASGTCLARRSLRPPRAPIDPKDRVEVWAAIEEGIDRIGRDPKRRAAGLRARAAARPWQRPRDEISGRHQLPRRSSCGRRATGTGARSRRGSAIRMRSSTWPSIAEREGRLDEARAALTEAVQIAARRRRRVEPPGIARGSSRRGRRRTTRFHQRDRGRARPRRAVLQPRGD